MSNTSPEQKAQELGEIPKYLEGVPIVFDWCYYNGERVFASFNYEESEKKQKAVFDIAYCATKAINGTFLKRRFWSKRFTI